MSFIKSSQRTIAGKDEVIAELRDELAAEKIDAAAARECVIMQIGLIRKRDSELAALKEFTRHVIQKDCWSLYEELDGGDLQDLAEKLGLIEQHTATVADVDEESDFEVGDIIYKFADILKGAKP